MVSVGWERTLGRSLETWVLRLCQGYHCNLEQIICSLGLGYLI